MGQKHAETPASQNKRRLALVFGLTAIYLVAEVIWRQRDECPCRPQP